MNETWKTFDDWKKAGRAVMRGERSKRRDGNGIALFSYDQTMSREDMDDWLSDLEACVHEIY